MQNITKVRSRVLIAAAVMVLVPMIALGQSDETDNGEVAGYSGGAFGLGSHPVVGASTGAGFARYAMGIIDISYTPFGENTLRVRPANEIVRHSGVYDFNFGIHIRIPVTKRLAPYAIVGAGLMYDTFDLAKATVPGTAVFQSHSETYFGFHTGAGLRYYVREHWGIRPETKVVMSNRTYVSASIGIFYVLPSYWP